MSRIEELEKRLAADPNSRIFVQLAEAYRKEGLLDNAIEVCEAGLAKHPEYPSARVALGRALLEAESFERAREEFETVLERVPDNILANKFLGATYHRLGRYEDAIQKYEIAQTFAPEDAELGTRIQAVRADLVGAADETVTDESLPGTPAAAPPIEPAEPFVEPPASAAEPSPGWEAPVAAGVLPTEGLFDESPGVEQPAAPAVEEDLAPIPLVEVGEPMVLEDRAYTPPAPTHEPEPAPEPALESLVQPTEPQTEETPPAAIGDSPSVAEDVAPVDSIPLVDPPDPFAPPNELEVEPPERASPEPTDIETPTVAELYAEQGHFDKAILVYQKLLAREPQRAQYLERIQELETHKSVSAANAPVPGPEPSGDPAPPDASRQRTIDALQKWLDAIQQSRRA